MRYTGNILLIILIVLVWFQPNSPDVKCEVTVREVIKRPVVVDTFSVASMIEMLDSMNIRHTDIVVAQSAIETGNYTSTIFKECNNLFGMKLARQRATTATGTHRGHAKYNTWRDSVIDYALFYNKYLSRLSRDELFDYLSKNYAQDINYVQKIKNKI